MNEVWQIAMTIVVLCLVADSGLSKIIDYRASKKASLGKHSYHNASGGDDGLEQSDSER